VDSIEKLPLFPLMQAPSKLLVNFKAAQFLRRFSNSSQSLRTSSVFSISLSQGNMAGLDLKVPLLKMSDGNAIPMVGLTDTTLQTEAGIILHTRPRC
jgi:hypothetical protein